MNILFFQFGDYGEAYRRFEKGGPETFRDQRLSVDFVASLRSQYAVTTVAVCGREHKEDLDRNLSSIGISVKSAYRRQFITQLLDDIGPQLVVCCTPHYYAIQWAKRKRIPTLLALANFFSNRSPRQFLRNMALRALLIDTGVFPCVGNHSLNASVSVAKALFYPESRIVPWDWSRMRVEEGAKTAPRDPDHPSAFFAGTLSEAKGVGDCLRAVVILRDRGINLTFEFAGAGDLEYWRKRASELGVGSRARFLGRIWNAEVRQRMIGSDIVVIPSRHEYAEGLPNTLYEALASRTPTIVSDHPAFASRLRNGENCLIFRAADAASLADRIAALVRDNVTYARLSERSAAAHNSLYFGMDWSALISNFLDDPQNRTGWVEANSLARLRR